MKQLFFWNRWNAEHRNLYLLFLGIFFLSLCFFLGSYFIGERAIIQWEVTSVMEPFMVAVDRFTQNLFDYSVEIESYILKENYFASEVHVNLLSSYIFFSFLIPALLAGIVVSTFLDSFSYFIGTGLLMLLIVTLNLDLLNILGYQNKIPAVLLIALFGGLSYYFKSFKNEISFTWRFVSFFILFLLCGVFVNFTSSVLSPVLYLTNFGITVPILLTLLFIAIIGFENINLFLYLSAGSSNTPDNSTRIINFSIISVLYLSNVLLMLLKKMLYIHWDILYINAFYLYCISSIVGIWGYKKRSVIFKDMLPFNPLGGLFYLTLAIVANATIAYAFITGNDPLAECFEYGIIYAHVFFGSIYFLYILINFAALFKKKISIYEIVYKPLNMPFFMVRGISGAGILSLFLYSNNFALYLGFAGYYNLAGDVYKYENNLLLAKQYYLSGVRYEHQNHRSNYSLAGILAKEDNREGQAEYYAGSLVKRPFEYTYVNLGNLYLKENSYFQAMFIVQEGLSKFPDSPYLANNLAMLYSRTELIDSIFYYLDHSIKSANEEPTPATNYIYTVLKKNLLQYADTVVKKVNFPKDMSFQSNKLLLENVLNKNYQESNIDPAKFDSLRPVSFSFLYNDALNRLKRKDDSLTIKQLDRLLTFSINEPFKDALQLLKVMKLYYTGERKAAFLQLENLKNISSNTYFNKVSGIWMMEQHAFLPAEENFFQTIRSGGSVAILNYCMALCESGKFKEASPFLQELKKSNESTISTLASELEDIANTEDIRVTLSWDEIKKLRYLHLKRQLFSKEQLQELLQSFQSENLSKMAMAEVVEEFIDRNNIASALEIYTGLKRNAQEKTFGDGMLNLVWLKLLNAQQKWPELKTNVNSIFLNPDKENLRSFYKGCAAEGTGDDKNAIANFEVSIKAAPYFEGGIIHAVGLYNKLNQTSKAYDVIADAVQFNPTSIQLLSIYAKQALKNNLESYADDALKQLKNLMNPVDFEKFRKEYEADKQQFDEGQDPS